MPLDFKALKPTEEQLKQMGDQQHLPHDCEKPTVQVLSNQESPIKTLSIYAKKQCCQFVIGFISLVGGNLAQFAVPALIGIVLDAMKNQDWDTINFYCMWMLIFVLFSAASVWIRGQTFNTISERIAYQLRYDLFYFLINKDVRFFDEMKTGDILSRISSDTAVVQNALGTNISMFLRSVIQALLTIVVLLIISWKLTLVTIAGVLPVVIIGLVCGRFIKKYAEEVQTKKGELGQIAEEAITNVRTVKAFSTEAFEIKKHMDKNQEVFDSGAKMSVFQGAMSFFIMLSLNSCMAGIIYTGAVLYEDGEITIGDISAFLLYMI